MCQCDNTQPQDGDNGYNAFTTVATTLTASFVANGSTQYTVVVTNNQTTQYTGKWAVAGQTIYIGTLGECTVISSTSTQIIFTIPTYNATVFPATLVAGSKISPAGARGASGAATTVGKILYNTDSAVSTTGTIDETLNTYTIAAMANNGDTVIIRNSFITSNVSTNFSGFTPQKSCRMELDSQVLIADSIPYVVMAPGIKKVTVTTYLTRTSSTGVYYSTEINTYDDAVSYTATFAKSGKNQIISRGSLVVADATSMVLNVIGQSNTLGEITSQYLNIEYIPKV